MAAKFVKYKPGVKRRTHLLMSALLWPLVGSMLLFRGVLFISAPKYYWLIVLGFLIGLVKSHFIFDRTAKKGIDRILRFGDNTCIGAVYSIKTWGMVLVMMLLGVLLRHSTIPPQFLGPLYIAIGSGLIMSSRHAWMSWYRLVIKKKDKVMSPGAKEDV